MSWCGCPGAPFCSRAAWVGRGPDVPPGLPSACSGDVISPGEVGLLPGTWFGGGAGEGLVAWKLLSCQNGQEGLGRPHWTKQPAHHSQQPGVLFSLPENFLVLSCKEVQKSHPQACLWPLLR